MVRDIVSEHCQSVEFSGGVIFSRTYQFYKNKDGSVRSGLICRRAFVQGAFFQAGSYVSYFRNGRLQFAHLSEPSQINGMIWMENSQLSFFPEKSDIPSRYRDSLRVEYALSDDSYEIQGVPCQAAQPYGPIERIRVGGRVYEVISNRINGVLFYESGLLANCLLLNDYLANVPVGRLTFAKGSMLVLYELATEVRGRVASGVLAEDHQIEGVLYRKGQSLRFDEQGKIIP